MTDDTATALTMTLSCAARFRSRWDHCRQPSLGTSQRCPRALAGSRDDWSDADVSRDIAKRQSCLGSRGAGIVSHAGSRLLVMRASTRVVDVVVDWRTLHRQPALGLRPR